MPRPERIEYENAYYHVMNRGKKRQIMYHGDEHYQGQCPAACREIKSIAASEAYRR